MLSGDDAASFRILKRTIFQSWLRNVQAVLEEMDHGRTATEVEKSLKKQQAIANDIIARVSCWALVILWIVESGFTVTPFRRIASNCSPRCVLISATRSTMKAIRFVPARETSSRGW